MSRIIWIGAWIGRRVLVVLVVGRVGHARRVRRGRAPRDRLHAGLSREPLSAAWFADVAQ